MALKTIGSLWTGRPGSKAVMSGHMEGPNRTRGPKVLIFPNEKATPENRQPNFRICVDDGEAAPTEPRHQADSFDEETPF